MDLKTLVFDDFAPVMRPFVLPANTVIYRACVSDEVLTDRVRFFGSKRTAGLYERGRMLRAFATKKQLTLVDIRYVIAMMKMITNSRQDIAITTDITNLMLRMHVALGLCTFEKQIFLLDNINLRGSSEADRIRTCIDKMRDFFRTISTDRSQHPPWLNPIEPAGVRVGITDIDYFVMDVLKQLFKEIADGIISPILPSPFHNQEGQQILEEIVLFNPSDALKQLPTHPTQSQAPVIALNSYLNSMYQYKQLQYYPWKLHIYSGGLQQYTAKKGKTSSEPNRDLAYTLDTNRTFAISHDRRIGKLDEWVAGIKKGFPSIFTDNTKGFLNGANIPLGMPATANSDSIIIGRRKPASD